MSSAKKKVSSLGMGNVHEVFLLLAYKVSSGGMELFKESTLRRILS